MSEPITESSEQLLKIKETVTEQDLKNTVFNSNIEVGIYRSKELVVINGTENEIGMTADKTKESSFTYHSHIPNHEFTQIADSPSFSDIFSMGILPNKNHFIGHQEGITQFRFPDDEDQKDLVIGFLRKKGIGFSYSRGVRNGDLTDIDKIPLETQFVLQREFSDTSGIVVKRTPWEDKKGIQQILDLINS